MSAASQVAIVMGSESDKNLMAKCEEGLAHFGVSYETFVLSAHRTPEATAELAQSAQRRGFRVLIGGAGMAAHLPGVLAAHTTLPVIGVPINASALAGVDALYSIVQMPKGVPVATVGIDGALNAAVLAVQMLALEEPALTEKLEQFKKDGCKIKK